MPVFGHFIASTPSKGRGCLRLLLVSRAANYRKAGIFGIEGVASCQLTQIKDRPAIGFDLAAMHAVQTQSDAPPLLFQIILIGHASRIASTNTPPHSLANHGDFNEGRKVERWRKTIGSAARRRFGSVRRSAELRGEVRRNVRP